MLKRSYTLGGPNQSCQKLYKSLFRKSVINCRLFKKLRLLKLGFFYLKISDFFPFKNLWFLMWNCHSVLPASKKAFVGFFWVIFTSVGWERASVDSVYLIWLGFAVTQWPIKLVSILCIFGIQLIHWRNWGYFWCRRSEEHILTSFEQLFLELELRLCNVSSHS